MAAMKAALQIVFLVLLIAFSIWLFYEEEAARPGALRPVHEESAVCNDCHTPWQGVSDEACLGCHQFGDVFELRPAIRFHEAETKCVNCHTEHRGIIGRISEMNHALLNPELLCSDCHFDPHEQLFGENCRQCHGIAIWDIPGYRHPPAERQNCEKCHRSPLSHTDQLFWRRLETRHQIKIGDDAQVKPRQCWQCHVIHSWRHLRM
jgi:hypothetical protein